MDSKEIVIQILTATMGTLGFAILFHMKRKYLLYVTMGGTLSWALYLLFEHFLDGVFIPTLFASFFVALYSEILARVLKAPSTPFFAVSMVPLLPGKSLYYTMAAFLSDDLDAALNYGSETFSYALGIAAGMSIIWAMCDFYRKITKQIV